MSSRGVYQGRSQKKVLFHAKLLIFDSRSKFRLTMTSDWHNWIELACTPVSSTADSRKLAAKSCKKKCQPRSKSSEARKGEITLLKKKKNEDCNNSLHSFSVKIAADAPLALLVPLNIFRRGFLHFVLRMLELTNVSPYLGSSWCDGHNSHSFFSFVTFFCFCFRLAFSTSCRIETRQAIPSVES